MAGAVTTQEVVARLWQALTAAVAPLGARIAAGAPAGLPRWAWAGLIVLAGYVAGLVGARLLTGLLRLALLVAAVAIGWQVLRG